MKKILIASTLIFSLTAAAQNSKLKSYAEETYYTKHNTLEYIRFKPGYQPSESDVTEFINSMVLSNGNTKVSLLKTEKDQLGFSNSKYILLHNGVQVFNKIIAAHVKDGHLVSLNGDLQPIAETKPNFAITENSALDLALKTIKAKIYKWELKDEEAHMRQALNDPSFTYHPKGEKVLFEKDGKYYSAYKFNIYAHEPMSRANVFVDAVTGKVLAQQSLICTADVPGSAATKYSGTQTLTIDQNGGTYRLREAGRGNGIETYNMGNTTNYTFTDFTNATTSWTTVNADQGARDAHWGAENTYDYFMNTHNRNSIDGAGYKLLSYVHYSVNFNNAFWDGSRMTYGDGNGVVFTILTSQDVCGHEITHGLVSNTGGLNGGGTGEPDALNEAFSDIFGTSIERYAKPSGWEWKIGAEITPSGNGLRNMSNPNLFNDPDTYGGTYWDPAGQPHNNAGPCDYWYYLLVTGGSGTNDIGNAFNVTGIGHADAQQIAYRALTVYFTPSTTYANARAYSIQAAKDLFGACSNQVQQTTNAWYAVGVGAQFVPGVIGPDFSANITNICALPANISFNNMTQNGLTFTWNFGDGATSTGTNPVHSYTANGTYNVKLKATGCIAGSDSITKSAYIVVNAPSAPSATGAIACSGSTMNLTASGNASLKWYAAPGSTVVIGTGTSYVTSPIFNTINYYVANTTTNAPVSGGILSNVGGGNLNNVNQWLVFDVAQAGTLQSVVAYASGAGNRTIQLRSSNGTILSSTTIAMTAGANTLNLNFNLTPGTGYQLGLGGATSNLYRTSTGVAFPYNIGGVVSIVNSSAGSGFYYFFYNWKVRKADCVSAQVAVTASVYAAPAINVTATSTLICHENTEIVQLSASPTGGTFTGPGVTGNNFDPAAAGNGTHTVTYNYTDNNGCSNLAMLTLVVVECTGLNKLSVQYSSVSVYPNPANETVFIKNAQNTKLKLSDATGRIVLEQTIGSNEEKINVASLAKGIYFISLQGDNNTTVKTIRFILQ